MSLFRKSPPSVCPKCGKADGWHIARYEVSPTSDGMYYLSGAPIRGPFGTSPRMKAQTKKVRYQCNNCGFEKSF